LTQRGDCTMDKACLFEPTDGRVTSTGNRVLQPSCVLCSVSTDQCEDNFTWTIFQWLQHSLLKYSCGSRHG